MSAENRIEKNNTTGELIKKIFLNNWDENFLFDGIENRILTYKNFFELVIKIHKKLNQLGIRKNDQICLLMNNSVNVLVLYFASLLSQSILILLDPLRGKNEIMEIFSMLKPKIVISDFPDLKNNIDTVNFDSLQSIELSKIDSKSELDSLLKINFDNEFLMTFTSGSTGIPKGVIHSFNNLLKSALAFKKKFNFQKNHVFFHNLPMSYMAGILNLFILPFISGSKIVVSSRFNISNIFTFWNDVIKFSANTFWFTPTMIGLLLKFDRGSDGISYTNKNKILGCVGTAPLNPHVKKKFEEKYNIKLYESYGLSEALFVSTNFPTNDNMGVGELLDGVKIDSYKNEILINVPWMFLRYNKLKKSDFFKDDMYISGDLGELHNNKNLIITGRKKDLIIKGGMNISPKKIEDLIDGMKAFNENIVLGIPDEILGEKIVCFLIKKNQSIQEIKKSVNLEIVKRLGKDYHIDEFVEMTNFPYTSSGKINKPKIRESYLKSELV